MRKMNEKIITLFSKGVFCDVFFLSAHVSLMCASMGKRARIPSQKALVAQASSSLVTTNQGRKGNQNKFDVVVNQSPRGKENTQLEEQLTEEETESHVKMQEEWVKMVQSPTSSRKLSWAEVVEAAEETVAKRPIWDNFDIGKISNAGFKLGYIAPETHVLHQRVVPLQPYSMALFSKAAISEGMNPYVFVTYRQAFAVLALAPLAAFFERKTAVPLSYNILFKILLMSFLSTLSLNLYYFSIHYTTATFAAATTNIIPSITFVMAIILRVETLSIKQSHGMAKVLGSSICVSGALVFALVKGPHLNFMNWSMGNTKGTHSSNFHYTLKEEWIKGSLVMLLANITWSLWLILHVPIIKQYSAKLRLATLYCLFSCIQSSVWAMAMERNISAWKLKWDINLFSVAYCGVIVTGITYWLQLWAVEKKGPVFTAMFTPLSLIITAIVSAFLWKETLYMGSVCGGILLVGGLYLVLWGKNREAERKVNKDQILETKEGTTVECITLHSTSVI
ncbi:WAT1-related protein At1g43650 isoform X4 [Nicotiana tabacum]|uniref:WAT1-related protein At1g43650 isoform X4 n=1 Tax=Nicotiana tabacum TaxID=4097 RepID=A0A1S4BVH4_TOBAC